MRKTTLYVRVLTNFAFLLLLLTTMTLLTLNILSDVDRNFKLTANDIKALNYLEKTHHAINNAPDYADEYVRTGKIDSRKAYELVAGEIDVNFSRIKDELSDTVVIQSAGEVHSLFHIWKTEIGDKRILLGDERLGGKSIDESLKVNIIKDFNTRYLTQARELKRSMAEKIISAQQRNISLATSSVKDISRFIGLVNILLAVFAMALGFVLTRSITNPIRKLKEGTQNIMAGKFEPIIMQRSDELGQLASDFNKMSAMLGNNYTRLNAYSELVTELNTKAELKTIQRESLRILCHHSQATVGALYLLDGKTALLELTAGYALKMEGSLSKVFAHGEGIPGQCLAEKKMIEVHDVIAMPGLTVDTGLVEIAPQHVIAVPIPFQDTIIGVLILGTMHPFDDLRREIVSNSTPQLGVAIMNARNFEATQQLSTEVAKKNEEVNAKNEELEKAYRVKSEFLASMSHELRTPLNSIIGFSSVLLGPTGDPLSDDQRMGLSKVLKNGKHLLQLINDILDFSKIESGRMNVNVENDEVANVVSNSLATVESMIKSKNLEVKQRIASNLPLLHTDVLKVKQILVNLLSNATKFTEQGEIVITVEQKNSMIVFSIKDSGIGIEPQNFNKVFEEFQQIDSSNTRKYKGTGLGMPISRRLSRLLGGDLTFDSEYGKGSTFILRIPPVFSEPDKQKQELATQKPLPPAPELKHIPLPQGETGIQILCIDDDPDVIEILKKYLMPEGYQVTGALSGDEGLRIAAELHPSLITLDIMMPQKDGWQVLRELKKNNETKNIPVVIHSMIDNRPLALSLGAFDVFTKPADPKELLAMVAKIGVAKEKFVMLVDDNEDFIEPLKIMLIAEGFKVKTANNGRKALELLKESIPSVLVLDLVMPEMDGFAVLHELQKDERLRSIPVVVLSGKELTETERQMLNSYSKEYLNKGTFSHETFTQSVKRILQKTV